METPPTLPRAGLCSSTHQLQQVVQGGGEGEPASSPGAAAADSVRQVRVQGGEHRPAEGLAVHGPAGPQQEFERAGPEGGVRHRYGRHRGRRPGTPIHDPTSRYFPVGNHFNPEL